MHIKYISKIDFDNINKRSLVESGDILFAMIGTVGSPVIVETKREFAIKNVALFKFANNKILINKFLKELLNFEFIKTQIRYELKGSNRNFVSLSILRDLKIPLLPKEIQEKIVKEIGELEGKEEKNKEKIKELNESISEIIEKVYLTTRNKESLGNISEIKNGGTPSSGVSEYWNGGIPWATLVDTKNKYLTKTVRSISKEGIKNSSATLLPVNAVLFSSRATIGDVSIAKIEVCTNQGYKNFICNPEKIHFEFLYYILKREAKNIENLASGMTYPEISKTLISEYKIPLPQFTEQQKIVNEIEKIEQKIETLQTDIKNSKKKKEEVLRKYLLG